MRKGRHPTHPPFPSCNRPRHRCTARRVRSRPFQNIYFVFAEGFSFDPSRNVSAPGTARSLSEASHEPFSISGASQEPQDSGALRSFSAASQNPRTAISKYGLKVPMIFSPGDPGVSQKPLRSLSGASSGASQEPLRIQELSGASQQPPRTLARQ